ncbi:condensin complex subunit 1 [Verticillium alfalfae VaMs.102]|uniref:Condensin complex subunit 1 n=1 Tax=Verticillium alfalfae (strain VaMs.102 / ATCC MYA-4576 / FGSC 10136) TaxID=526221 RepID=C9SY37_VERA1|nr:condensin complex subunit 1 [Verticillium alfalfae VaMs.102]EEY23702.1 condensin complex subunit 1 [Verticillium alfalfae VaMs.102]
MSGLAAEADAILHDLESPDDQETLAHHKHLLEVYGFLLQWTVAAVETKAAEKSSAQPVARGRGKPKKNAPKGQEAVWDSSAQLQPVLDIMSAQINIVQNLTYFEHLSEPMAEFLHILAETYDYPQLADEILRELSNKEFNSNDTKGPKSVSQFIVKLSELAPRLVIKQMTMLAKQLDSESYTLRCSLIEVCGNMVAHLSRQEERGENHKSQLNAFFDVLEERFLDINPYCRCRAIQVYVKICDLEQKFPKRRQKAAELACRSLEDKSSNVRRNAIKLLGALIKTHPFTVMHGAQLSRKEWQARLDKVDEELNALQPPEGAPGLGENANTTVDPELLDDATQVPESPQKKPAPTMTDEERFAAVQKAREEAATSEAIEKLGLTKRYYSEALKFIDVLHEATGTICQLLGSRNKSEVIEAMDYFEVGDAYNIEQNKVGIRRMLRLIWTKGNSDEGKGVQTHLIDCYKRLFFEAPESFSPNDAANYIARNMISLTFGASPAELTSLEQLLATMMKGGLIPRLRHCKTVASLWCSEARDFADPTPWCHHCAGHAGDSQPRNRRWRNGNHASYRSGCTRKGRPSACQVYLHCAAQDQSDRAPGQRLTHQRRKQDLEKDKTAKADPAAKKDKTEEPDDLDLIGGTTEDDFTEAMAHIRERELLFGSNALLAQFGPLVSEICANNTTYADKGLQAAATLCLAKLMCVSSEYCEANLPLLITIMERSTDATVRSNAVIALGDMAVCFNHLIDENTDFLYRRLADSDQSVKRTCLMTLTFLILAGQVKVKGQLGEMAKCLEDEDRRIADLARMFFTELSTKDNAVYNHFVDMFSLLSAEKGLGEESFRRIVRFLLGFVEKDKHARQLADKLAARLARCDTERQWNDVAFALGLLPHKNEEIARVVGEGFKLVQVA